MSLEIRIGKEKLKLNCHGKCSINNHINKRIDWKINCLLEKHKKNIIKFYELHYYTKPYL